MIEVQTLIQPVSSDSPAGESLRYSQIYDSIKGARREDDANAPQGIWQTKLKKADWKEVKSICLEALQKRSKDLQIGAWLLEACIHLDGFAGVADGFRVLTALSENFWDTLYPPLDPDDPELRYAPVSWIDEKLTLKLKLIAITRTEDERSYTWADRELGIHQVKVAARDKTPVRKGQDSGRLLQTQFDASVNLTPNDFYIDLREQLTNALEEAERFERVLVHFDKRQEGALHQMKEMLRTILHFVSELLDVRGVDVKFEPFVEREDDSIREKSDRDTANDPRDYAISGPIRSRAQAYHMLAEAAEYLMRTEPHSPTPYLVKRAVAWGSLSLGELLQQVLRNPGELTEVARLLGLDDFNPKGKKTEEGK
ncbi:MAG TPA: type VI secretion system protein TssA [Terriglobia bacterium]|jgi:type VI secretion system protein ImpA